MEYNTQLWYAKYAPKNIDELSYSPKTTQLIRYFSSLENFPGLIFVGLEGAGKKTRIKIFLKEFIKNFYQEQTTENSLKLTNSEYVNNQGFRPKPYINQIGKTFEEFYPKDLEGKDRIYIQSIMNKFTQNCTNNNVIVLHDIENLSLEAQYSLRRTMEKISYNCRVIISCQNLTKIIPALRSRFQVIRVIAPNSVQIFNILKDINQKENCNLTDTQLNKIAKNANGNLRRSIMTMQITVKKKLKNERIFRPEYLITITNIVNKIFKLEEKNDELAPIKFLEDVDKTLTTLVSKGIKSETIFKCLLDELLKVNMEDDAKLEIISITAYYENMSARDYNPFKYLMAYIAYITDMFVC